MKKRGGVRARLQQMASDDAELKMSLGEYQREFHGRMRHALETAGLAVEPYIQEIRNRQAGREVLSIETLREWEMAA